MLFANFHPAETHRERDFMCDLCGKAFFSKYQLKSHGETHSKSVIEEAAECDICHKVYVSRVGRCFVSTTTKSDCLFHQNIHLFIKDFPNR